MPPERRQKAARLIMTLCAFAYRVYWEYAFSMSSNLKQLPVDERIRLVEDLWDSIASDQSTIPLTTE